MKKNYSLLSSLFLGALVLQGCSKPSISVWETSSEGEHMAQITEFEPAKKTVLIEVNTKEERQTLTGIGESRAEAIILYRETNGAFETIEDIMKVTGIKNALFNNIKNDITVE